MTSSVTTPRSCRSFLRRKKHALAVLLMCDFMDNAESNITPRLRTVWAHQTYNIQGGPPHTLTLNNTLTFGGGPLADTVRSTSLLTGTY